VVQAFESLLAFLWQQPIAKVTLNCKLGATRRLAVGVVPELDACFAAWSSSHEPASHRKEAQIGEALGDMASLVDRMEAVVPPVDESRR
jgi:hypothetical protein